MSRWEKVLDATMLAHGAGLLAYARTLTGDGELASTVVEDALAAVFGRRACPRDVDGALAEVQSAIRRAAVRVAADGSEAESGARTASSAAPRVEESLRALPVRERALLAMRYIDGLAVPAICRETALHAGMVGDALTHAVEYLDAAHPELRLDVHDALAGGALARDVVTIGDGW
ncbi:RNA polymerase sigma factor [Demequina iriomotensis]|uniref:RNA polymerase sigma factor n=1 Tax=Demequina iriomotensis TaxID=1536641 RepID=UPI0007807A5E|nr:hypothetical protein [Demequina iriomotensis]